MKKNNYIFFICFILFFQISIYSQGTWKRMQSPTDKYLRAVYFVDSLYGWAVGDSGIIVHTSDAGRNWTAQDSKTENNIYDVFFLNRNLGWASSWKIYSVPFGTELLKTTNGGTNWTKPSHPEENIFIACILFTDSLSGWMGGRPHAIVKTTDGGASWEQAETDSSTFSGFPVQDIKFYNSRYGYASGGVFEYAGVIWRTTNGGDLWYVIDPMSAPVDPVWQIHIYDSVNVIGVGGDFEFFGVGMIRTSDGGINWSYEYIGLTGVAFDIDFRTAYEVWATLGFEEKLIYSLDSGITWNQISTPDSTIIYDMIFPDSLHGFAVGRDGAIIKYNPQPLTTVIGPEYNIHSNFNLEQNYPNPFNPITKIKYSIHEDGFVRLAVYNLLGEEVALPVNEQQKAENYEIEFNAEKLPSGVYIYSLETPQLITSKKMIVLH